MIKKISNWLFGGFFRTIGRSLAVILLGALFAYFAYKSGFKITDLFGIEKVSAATSWSTSQSRAYYDNHGVEGQTSFQNTPATITSDYPITQLQYRVRSSSGLSTENYYSFTIGYLATPDSVTPSEVRIQSINIIEQFDCGSWYRDANDGYQKIKCGFQPINEYSSSDYLYIRVVFAGGGSYLTNIKTKLTGYDVQQGVSIVITENTQKIIESQNAINDSLNDSNTSTATNDALDFFNNFNDNSHGLSSIITTPLNTIRLMLSDTCVAPHTIYKGKTISLPCGSILWSRSGADSLKDFLNLVYGGLLSYYLVVNLFSLVNDFKNPDNDKIEVTDL